MTARTSNRPHVDLSRIDQLPPHSIEAEQGVLGCVLVAPEKISVVIESGLVADWFYDLRHRTLWEAFLKINGSGKPIDMIVLGQVLKDSGQFDGIGGLAYLSALVDSVPSGENVSYYIDILREKHLARAVLSVASGFVSAIYQHDGHPETLVSELEVGIAAARGSGPSKTLTMRSAVREYIDDLQAKHERRQAGGITGMPIGIRMLDRFTLGIQTKQLTVIGARPSVGKSAFAQNICQTASIDGGIKACYMTHEMTPPELIERWLASMARVDSMLLRSGDIMTAGPEALGRLTAASGRLGSKDSPLVIRDITGHRFGMILSAMRRLVDRGVKLFVIDYIQLIRSDARERKGGDDRRSEEISVMCADLKSFAKMQDVAVVALAQINRDAEKGTKIRKPRKSDLKESGGLEEAGDLIMLIHRDIDNTPSDAEIMIAKQRMGPTGGVEVEYLKEYCQFVDRSPVSSEPPKTKKGPLPGEAGWQGA